MNGNFANSRHVLYRQIQITMQLIVVSCSFLQLVQAQSAAETEMKPSYDIARAIAQLAKLRGEVDIQVLSQYLKLPNLEHELTWQGPLTESEASNISAVYTPPDSALGIAKVYLSRKTSGTAIRQGKSSEFHSLSLFLKPGSCPTESALTDAIGNKATKTQMPGYDGGPSYTTTTFFVPQSLGEPVQVSFVGENTCNVTISHYRPM